MTDLTLYRVYEPHECGADGYPIIWHRGILRDESGPFVIDPSLLSMPGQHSIGVKDLVREQAEHRCERCGHPFVVGEGGTWERESLESTYVATPELLREGDPAEMAPYRAAASSGRGILWSPCDERCTHGGPVRLLDGDRWGVLDSLAEGVTAGSMVHHHVQAAWRILTVHHLNGRKHDLRWWNLASLCQRCHLTIQRKVWLERVWPWEHSPWFEDHAAGWYAYAYLGENLTREAVRERRDALLALERAA